MDKHQKHVALAVIGGVIALFGGLIAWGITNTMLAADSKVPSCEPHEVLVGSGYYDDTDGEWETYNCMTIQEWVGGETE